MTASSSFNDFFVMRSRKSQYYDILDSSEGQAVLRLFNDKYPHTGFTDTKKIDFLMWVDI